MMYSARGSNLVQFSLTGQIISGQLKCSGKERMPLFLCSVLCLFLVFIQKA